MSQNLDTRKINLYEIKKGEITKENIIFELNDGEKLINNDNISMCDRYFVANQAYNILF